MLRQNERGGKPRGGRLTVSLASRYAPAAITAVFAWLVVTPACGGWFGCGCDWPWNGLFIHCTVLRGIRPACPWCEHPALGLASLALPLSAGMGLASLGRRCARRRSAMRLPIPELALPVSLGMLGVLAGLWLLGALTPWIGRLISP